MASSHRSLAPPPGGRRGSLPWALVVLLLVLASCGSDDGGSVTTSTTTVTTQTSTTTSTTTSPSRPTVAVTSDDFGLRLVDGDGMSLYLFLDDAQGPSTCVGDCAASWPPFVGPATPGEGVDASLLGTSARSDGTEQVSYNGWPLYTYVGDQAPGDAAGQGLGSVWFVIDPEGNPVGQAG